MSQDIETSAKAVAAAIMDISTDDRGNFLAMVAGELSGNTQNFTAKCLSSAAILYGINPDCDYGKASPRRL